MSAASRPLGDGLGTPKCPSSSGVGRTARAVHGARRTTACSAILETAQWPAHGGMVARCRIRSVRVVFLHSQPRSILLEGPNRTPYPLRYPGLCRHVLDEFKSHIEFLAAGSAELEWCVGRSEKQDGYGRGKELMIEHLHAAVDICGGVEVCQVMDGLFG